jgi:hypothetical protein
MDCETRYDLPSQDVRTVGEEDEHALSEGERNEGTSECSPRSSSSPPPSRVVFIFAAIYLYLPAFDYPLQGVFIHLFPRHHAVPSFFILETL